jgi:hypothetical protein
LISIIFVIQETVFADWALMRVSFISRFFFLSFPFSGWSALGWSAQWKDGGFADLKGLLLSAKEIVHLLGVGS